MRKISSDPKMDKILEAHYNECFNNALERLKDESPEFLSSFCKAKIDEAEIEVKKFNPKKYSKDEKIYAVLRINEDHALRDACKELLKPRNLN